MHRTGTATITVAGLGSEVGAWLALNTGGRDADTTTLEPQLERRVGQPVEVAVLDDETALLTTLGDVAADRVNPDRHYLAAFNGERWSVGFDLPILRRACVRRDVDWPFPDVAYADVMEMMKRFHTGDVSDLEGVYELLIDGEHADPFDDNQESVDAYDRGDWADLLAHNCADIKRTRELAVLAGRYVAKSDYRMENLAPPDV